jgi:hypothetical protein
MNTVRRAAVLAASVALAFATPALAQNEWPYEPGNYVEVSGIEVDDGHSLEYAKHLSGLWRKGQDFARAQGWITGYEILENVHPRNGEPDIYLLSRFTQFPTKEEGDRRDAAYRAHMRQTEAQMQAGSGERAKYRRNLSTLLLREMVWKR